jgi:hypothetical protein
MPGCRRSQSTDVSVVSSIGTGGGATATQMPGLITTSNRLKKLLPATGRYLLILPGYTCTNCRAMESTVFPRENIVERFGQLEKVKLYTDGGQNASENQKFQFELTGTLALPTYAIVDPHTGNVLDQLIGFTRAPDFEKFLDRGLERYQRAQLAKQTADFWPAVLHYFSNKHS